MWVTTEGGGLCYTDPGYRVEALQFNTVDRTAGLPSNVTCGVAEDTDGTMWVSTTNGIANISGTDMTVTGLINYRNEVAGYQYSYGAVLLKFSRVSFAAFSSSPSMNAWRMSSSRCADSLFTFQ